jgi:hypothetical protein
MSEARALAAARAFADCLDRNEFESVAAMLAPDCHYVQESSLTSEGTLVGPDAILASYRWHDERSRRVFDRVEYSSDVEVLSDDLVVIRFTDIIEKDGETHSYSCFQRITFDEHWQIARIVQEDIPAEITAVKAFLERVGITL